MNKHATDTAETAAKVNQLWADFVCARSRAEKSRRLEDGIRAGHAWSSFLHAFVDAPPLAPGGL